MLKEGPAKYLSDIWNILDQLFVWQSVTNLIVQRLSKDVMSPLSIVMMLFSTLTLMTKSFFFLRIFRDLTFLVTMLK